MAVPGQVVGDLPARVDLVIYQGDDFHLLITVDTAVAGIDLTLCTPKAEIRSSAGSPDLVATFTASILDPVTIALHLPSTESVKLTANAAWDVQITDAIGADSTLAYGTVAVTRQVTV